MGVISSPSRLLALALVLLSACANSHVVPPSSQPDARIASSDAGVRDSDVVDATDAASVGRDASAADGALRDAGVMGDSATIIDASIGIDAYLCVPDCSGRTCGGDGCGGRCGGTCVLHHESFEHYPLRAVYPASWPETPYTFHSGLVLTIPIPNESGVGNPTVTACNPGGGFFGFLCADGARFIPDGQALMVMAPARPEHPFEFAFPSPARSVRVAVTDTRGAEDEIFHMDALNAAGDVIASAEIRAGPVANWRNNWLGIRVASPMIAKVRLHGDDLHVLALDNFYWE